MSAATKQKEDRLWTIEDVCDYLQMSKSTVYTYSSTQEIPSLRIGKYLRFDPAEVRKWARRKAR